MSQPLFPAQSPAKRIFGHILFWLAYYLYDGPLASNIELDPSSRIHTAAIALPVKIIATYFTLYLLQHFYNGKRRPGFFIVCMLLSVLFFGMAQRVVSYKIVYPVYYPDGLSHSIWYVPKTIMETFGVYSVVAIVIVIHLVKQWYLSQQERQQLQKEKLEAELKYLKAQIHPHFLFNTLNNLYALTITNSKKAPEIVYKLSQLMSYMLYDSNKPFVALQKEIDYIDNYITLEKIRYEDRLDVSLNILASTEHIIIAPLLILPLVENSFKHGFSNDIGKVWVHIDILVNGGQLIIKVENSKGKSEPGNIPDSGIGLSNLKKRLELIYKDRYEFITSNEDTYLAILKLKTE